MILHDFKNLNFHFNSHNIFTNFFNIRGQINSWFFLAHLHRREDHHGGWHGQGQPHQLRWVQKGKLENFVVLWEIIHFVCFMFNFCFYLMSRCWSGQTWSRRWAYDSSAKRKRRKIYHATRSYPLFSPPPKPYNTARNNVEMERAPFMHLFLSAF